MHPSRGTFAAAVATGLAAFGAAAGPATEGVLGPSHREPATPAEQDGWPGGAGIAAHHARLYGGPAEYPAALAYAMGPVLAACAASAEGLDGHALRRVALGADLPTILGRFRQDPATGRQVGYRPVAVEWRGGRKRAVALAP